MDLKKLISEYFESAQLLQIITSVNDQPWGATVYFAYDESLNIYWISRTDRRHSKEIMQNQKVAGVVVKYHTYSEKVRGVQLEGVAEELMGEEADKCMMIYEKRFNVPRARVLNISGEVYQERKVLYRLKPSYIVLFDEVNFPENPRQEYRP